MKLWYPAVILFLFLSCSAHPEVSGMRQDYYGSFIIHHVDERVVVLQDLVRTLEAAEKAGNNFFARSVPATHIYIYKDHKQFVTKKYGLIGRLLNLEWYIGDNIGEKVLLLSPDHPTRVHDYDSILGAVGHEYIHTVIYRLYPHCPLWLNEGVALYLTNGSRGEAIHQSMEFPPEKILTSGNPLYFANHNGYSFADSFIQYCIETYGKDALLLLMQRGDYKEVLGMPRTKVYQNWKTWLQRRMNG